MDYVASSTAVFGDTVGDLWTGFIGQLPIILGVAAGILIAFWLWGKIKRHGFTGSKG